MSTESETQITPTQIVNRVDALIALMENIPSTNAIKTEPSTIKSQAQFRLPTKRARLFTPNLGNILPSIHEGLEANFENVSIEIVKCPDLREWADLSDKGICGNTRLVDAGGVPFMFDPQLQSTVQYNINDIIHACDMKNGLVIGAGAADPQVVGKNAELIANIKIPNGRNNTHYAKMIGKYCFDNDDSNNENDGNDVAVCRHYNGSSCGCLCNLFISEGKCNEDVIHIVAKGRKGRLNFTNCIRESLQNVCGVGGDKQIGMGGVIKVKNGKIKGHVMPDFMKEKVDVMDPKQIAVDNWLYFYECGPQLIMMTTFISGDPTQNNSLHLRVEHTHFYSLKKGVNQGGHYHYDVTPKDIEYEAYLNTAQYIYRVEDAFQYNINKSGKGDNKFDASLIK